MDLTPDDIRGHDFPVGLRGYDTGAVRAFLDEVAEAFEHVLTEAGKPLSPDMLYDLVGQEVAAVLHNAQSVASGLAQQAEASANELRERAARMVEEARTEEQAIRQESGGLLATAQRDRETLLEDALLRQEAVARAEVQVRQAAEQIGIWLESAERSFAGIRAKMPDPEVTKWLLEVERAPGGEAAGPK